MNLKELGKNREVRGTGSHGLHILREWVNGLLRNGSRIMVQVQTYKVSTDAFFTCL